MKKTCINGVVFAGLLLSFQTLASSEPSAPMADSHKVSEKERAIEQHKKHMAFIKRRMESKQAEERKSAKVKIEKRADKK